MTIPASLIRAFIPNVGNLAQAAVNRSAFDIGKPGSNSYIVDQMFKQKYGRDLDDTSARWLQGFFVLADAINRAGSTGARQDPGRAEGDRSQARSAHHGL